ncbi:MAG: hypothetical protein ACRDKZ_13915 [Actinomycetota bacterium]
MHKFGLVLRVAVALAVGALPAVPAAAGHGPERAGTDPCNGTDAFNLNNVVSTDVVAGIAEQNPEALNADGTLDRTQITHALLEASGHVALQVRASGTPFGRVAFEFSGTDSAWTGDSTTHPAYLTAIEAREDPARDIDGDLVVGGTHLFFIPTDVVPDGNYVARLRAFDDAGAELGRLCLDAIVANGQGGPEAAQANGDPSYEPLEDAGQGFAPQPVVWFPAGEAAAQQGGYGINELRIEFAEELAPGSLKLEREEIDPANPAAMTWIDYTSLLSSDDLARPHFLAGGRMDETPLEALANNKVWGPGFKFPMSSLPAEALPNERVRVSAQDASGRPFCGVYSFTASGTSFLASGPTSC